MQPQRWRRTWTGWCPWPASLPRTVRRTSRRRSWRLLPHMLCCALPCCLFLLVQLWSADRAGPCHSWCSDPLSVPDVQHFSFNGAGVPAVPPVVVIGFPSPVHRRRVRLTLDSDAHGAGGAGDDLRCAFEAGGVEVFHLGGGDLVDLGLGQLGNLDGVRGS